MSTKIAIGFLVVALLSWIMSIFISVGEGQEVIHLITVSAFAFSSGTIAEKIQSNLRHKKMKDIVRRSLDAINEAEEP